MFAFHTLSLFINKKLKPEFELTFEETNMLFLLIS